MSSREHEKNTVNFPTQGTAVPADLLILEFPHSALMQDETYLTSLQFLSHDCFLLSLGKYCLEYPFSSEKYFRPPHALQFCRRKDNSLSMKGGRMPGFCQKSKQG